MSHADSAAPSPKSMPSAPFWLGATGAIPFVSLTLATLFAVEIPGVAATTALLAYGAVILSFLGGVHWGLAMVRGDERRRPAQLAMSVVPSLIAWPALLAPERPALIALAFAFTAWLVFDLREARASGAPDWYPRLRIALTAAVVPSLTIGAVFA